MLYTPRQTSSVSQCSELEARFESAIAGIDGISDVELIINMSEGEVRGAAAVCCSTRADAVERVSGLLASGLDLPYNRIYVVCN